MKNLATLFFALFLASTVFAQTENVQQIPPTKDGLRESYTPEDYQLFLTREQNGEIPFAGGLVDAKAAADKLVNNNNGSSGSANFTQSEMSIVAYGNNVIIGFNYYTLDPDQDNIGIDYVTVTGNYTGNSGDTSKNLRITNNGLNRNNIC